MTEVQAIDNRVRVGVRLSPLTVRWLALAKIETGKTQEELAEEALVAYLAKILNRKEEPA